MGEWKTGGQGQEEKREALPCASGSYTSWGLAGLRCPRNLLEPSSRLTRHPVLIGMENNGAVPFHTAW